MSHTISDEQWRKLRELLNRVADEREEDTYGPGSGPPSNSYSAQSILKELGMERKKAPGLS